MLSPALLGITLFFCMAGFLTGAAVRELADLRQQGGEVYAARYLSMSLKELTEVEI